MEFRSSDDKPMQRENISFMDAEFYQAAVEGKIDIFNDYAGPLNLLLTPNKSTVLHVHIAGFDFDAQTKKSDAFVDQILDKCPSLLAQENIKGETPLHLAARHRHSAIVEVLIGRANAQSDEDLERGTVMAKEMIRKTNVVKETALHEAARFNCREVVRKLMGEDPDFMYLPNEAGETPLFLAVERGYRRIVFEILKTCNSATHQGPNGRTTLHEAVITNDAEMIRKLVEANRNLSKEVDQQGWTPLHHAAHLGKLEIVKQLLKHDKRAAYVGDEDGKVPLHIAAINGKSHLQVLRCILEECPDCSEVVDKKGRNVLHFAVESGCEKVVEYLAGVTFLSNLINQKDEEGNTPLHLLANYCVASYTLIRHPLVDRNAVNNQNLTALDVISTSTNDHLSGFKGSTMTFMKEAGYKRSQRNVIRVEGRVSEMKVPDMEKVKEAHLIVATLVATVTFAAGFTLPGGYDGDDGTAILSREVSFKAFLVTDTIALLFSVSAVFIHFLLAMKSRGENKRKFFDLFIFAFYLIVIAMASMVLAFATGIYAVLPTSGTFMLSSTAVFPIIALYVFRFIFGSSILSYNFRIMKTRTNQ